MRWKAAAVGVALAAAVAAALGFFWPFGPRTPTLHLHGTVETQEVRLSSKVGGRVLKVAVAEGELVRPGQPLVYFEAPELEAQRDQARAKLDAAVAALEKLENGARPEEKAAALAALDAARAKLDRLEAGSRKEEIEQARGELASAQAEMERAQADMEREKLILPRASTRSQYDAAVAAYHRFRGQVQTAKAKLEMLEKGPRVEDIAEARANLDKAQADYDQTMAGARKEEIAEARAREAELRAKLKEAEVNLREAVVYAPEQAIVEVLPVRKGDTVGANQPVARVLRADDLWVKAFVPETELGKVRLNQDVEVTIDSYPDRRFAGKVVQIASVSEFTPRNVQSADERRHQVFGVKVRVADPQGIFRSGMAAEVWIPVR
jgi:HlyD family secretion protein